MHLQTNDRITDVVSAVGRHPWWKMDLSIKCPQPLAERQQQAIMAKQVFAVLLSIISLACAAPNHRGSSQDDGPVVDYPGITGRNSTLTQDPALRELAARRGQRIAVRLNNSQSTVIAEEGVNVNLDCLPWLMRFPGGSIEWFFTPRSSNGEVIGEPEERPPTPLDQLDVHRAVIGGTSNRWFNISSTIIVPGAEDASFGDYTCRVCSSMPQQCDSATISLHLLGAPPVLRKAVDNVPSRVHFNTLYEIGADFCLTFSKTETILLLCPILSNMSAPFPQPTRTWVKDGEVIGSGIGDVDIENSFFMSGNNTLFVPMVVDPTPLSLSPNGIIYLNTAVRNFTLPSMAPPGTTIENVRRRVFEQLLGSYSCSVGNVFGSDTAVTTVTECSADITTTAPEPMTTSTGPTPQMVLCYANSNCGARGSSVMATVGDCCSNLVDPVGFSYQTGSGVCQRCPIEFGFSVANFEGIERGGAHSVMAGYLSGSPDQTRILSLQLNLTQHTADSTDISLTTTRIRFFPNAPIQPVTFTFRVDGIAQENNETFAIEFSSLDLTDPVLFPIPPERVMQKFEGTIIDADQITLELSENDYRQIEGPNAVLEVLISKNRDVFLANPVTFRITPLTVDEAFRRGLIDADAIQPFIPGYPNQDDEFSPLEADTNDFDSKAFQVTFNPDTDGPSPRPDVPAPIPITDDEVDEAENQYFVVYLEILDATNFDLITQRRTAAIGIIVDDDDEPSTTAAVTDTMATTTEPIQSLYFVLNGQRYPSGSSLLITDIGEANGINLGSALACVTTQVNTQCCRGRDGGNVGEWFFPDGSMVPRNSGNRNADFSRSGFSHQVRMNRRNNAVGPVGTYTCRVPDATDSSVIHSATVTLELFLPLPRVVRCFEVVCVWQGPAEGSLEDYAGYEIRFGGEVVFQHENDEFFHVVDGDPRIQALGAPQDVTVEVRVRSNGDRQNPWSDPVPLSPGN